MFKSSLYGSIDLLKTPLVFILILFSTVALKAETQPDNTNRKIPAVIIARDMKPETNVTGWWISEKYDGVRGYWTGSKIISRSGRVFSTPEWFTKNFPPFPLDGELWTKRKDFQRLSGIVRSKNNPEGWYDVKYMIFDAPKAKGIFEERLKSAEKWFSENSSKHAKVINQIRCEGKAHLFEVLKTVESQGGEGLMLRRPGSDYISNNSHDLLKVKTFYDAEAVVISHKPGKGKHMGKMGSLLVELENGIRFYIGTGFTDKEREFPPPVGSIVKFRYKEFNDSGIPRFASFLRVRDKY